MLSEDKIRKRLEEAEKEREDDDYEEDWEILDAEIDALKFVLEE